MKTKTKGRNKEMKSPCFNCKVRHQSCHTECEKYKEYQRKVKEMRELKKKDFNKEYGDKDYKLTMYQKYLKTDGRKKKK